MARSPPLHGAVAGDTRTHIELTEDFAAHNYHPLRVVALAAARVPG